MVLQIHPWDHPSLWDFRTFMMFAFKATITTELVSADAGHGEEEGSENDGRLDHDHHGAGCVRTE